MHDILMIALVCYASAGECGPFQAAALIDGPKYYDAAICRDHAARFVHDVEVRRHAFRLIKTQRGQLEIICVKAALPVG